MSAHISTKTAKELGLIDGAERLPSKFKNKPVDDPVHGYFDSGLEFLRFKLLLSAESHGLIRNLRRQVPIICAVNGVHVCEYIADFVYETCLDDPNANPPEWPSTVPLRATWREITEDAKGARTAMYRLKKKLVFACTGIKINKWPPKRKKLRRKKATTATKKGRSAK